MEAYLNHLQSLDLFNTTQGVVVELALMLLELMEMDLVAESLVVGGDLLPKETLDLMVILEESYFLFLPLAILES